MTFGFSSDRRKRRYMKGKNSQAIRTPQAVSNPQPQIIINYAPQGTPPNPQGLHPHYAVQPAQPYPAASRPQPSLASTSTSNLRETLSGPAGRSVNRLRSKPSQVFNLDPNKRSTQALNQGAALCDRISSKLDAILTSIDHECFSGREQDLWISESPDPQEASAGAYLGLPNRGMVGDANAADPANQKDSNHFSKVWLYANARLPPHLPPFKVYLPTWPLICLAATYSEQVYLPPTPQPSALETHIPADWRSGTKAMVLKSLPLDDMATVVFSIRGSATFMDWAVNYKSAPSSPAGFLDDDGNLCHSGFLYVAKKMVKPVAERLKQLLEENPSRSHCSLLITGHSAGGAVAALLYAHMMGEKVESELNYLTSFFKRVHCITFGAPPISLLPLQRPRSVRHRKSLFFSIINEGDPVPRADKQVILSLLKLYGMPAPTASTLCTATASTLASLSKLNLSSTNVASSNGNANASTSSSRPSRTFKFSTKHSNPSSATTSSTTSTQRSKWALPTTTLSTAGRLVVIRDKPGKAPQAEDLEAVTIDDQLLRTVVYGDPVKHMMALYKRRVDILATRAVTGGGV